MTGPCYITPHTEMTELVNTESYQNFKINYNKPEILATNLYLTTQQQLQASFPFVWVNNLCGI